MTTSHHFRQSPLGRGAALIAGMALLGVLPANAKSACLKQTDAVSGTLRKVTIRDPETSKPITNWHIAPSEILCVRIDGEQRANVYDIQVEFDASVDLAKADELLGVPVGVQGKIVEWRHAGDTGDYVVTGAKFSDQLDDAGEIRRKQ